MTSKDKKDIREMLLYEMESLEKTTDRLLKVNNYDAAANSNARRDGVGWALFVLANKYGL